jgi:hypothetical protein
MGTTIIRTPVDRVDAAGVETVQDDDVGVGHRTHMATNKGYLLHVNEQPRLNKVSPELLQPSSYFTMNQQSYFYLAR